jgi:hypothetical protein
VLPFNKNQILPIGIKRITFCTTMPEERYKNYGIPITHTPAAMALPLPSATMATSTAPGFEEDLYRSKIDERA